MIEAKTTDGFTVQLDEAFLDDAELIEAMSRIDRDPAGFFLLRDRMLTAQDRQRLYDHLRNEKGVVPLTALNEALDQLLKSFKAGKNSSSSSD